MYCKYCGNIVEDDSVFCKHCGKKIESNVGTETSNTSYSILSRFTMLPQKIQILIIVYGIWLLGWICVLIANANDRHFAEDFVMPFFLCNVLLPFVIISGFYIYKMNKKKEGQKDSSNNTRSTYIDTKPNVSAVNTIDNNNVPNNTKVLVEESSTLPTTIVPKSYAASELLLTFARQKGKMQIVNKSSDISGAQEHYCLFTDSFGNTTRVDFNSQTQSLSAKEISEKKYQLCVNQLENGNYELAYINDKEIEDSLPF